MSHTPLEALPLEILRRRSSTKWRTYPDDVLPMFVAETDFPLAPAITAVLAEAVAIGDTGYTPPDPGIGPAFAGFADAIERPKKFCQFVGRYAAAVI